MLLLSGKMSGAVKSGICERYGKRRVIDMDIHETIVSGKALQYTKRERSKDYTLESISPALQEKYEQNGWVLDRSFSKKVRMKKPKNCEIKFIDEVWLTFANLGFTYLNRDSNFEICYDEKESKRTQHIDVFAADEETVVFVICRSAETPQQKVSFREIAEKICLRKEGIIREIRKDFFNKKLKIKFIFATNNYIILQSDIDYLDKNDVIHFDEEMVKYYSDLSKHLGHSARFQMLGCLFEGQKIPEIENIVPAIEGTMGGHRYYSFSIEPEKLLKIGYVLHKTKANKRDMPTYQRLIKRARLLSVQSFINGGGFFPNSIIINISTGGNGLRFDLSSLQADNSISKIGLLHLPQKYKSAYIIDGQHRLYGYSESKYINTNTIPVVAFVDLKREDQIKLFMEINENQKAVSKNLRNTLNADILWDSENYNEQRKALRLQIAQDLGEEKTSPLYDKVIVGENSKTTNCSITIDTIQIALNSSHFFSCFKGNAIIKDGTFDKGNNDATYDAFFPFIQQCFEYVKNGLADEWAKGESDSGFLVINAGIFSLIRLYSDIVDHLVARSEINPKSEKTEDIIEKMAYYLDPLILFLSTLSSEQKETLRKSYGTGGRTKYWRTLQKSIADRRPEFNPEGLKQYWIDNAKTFNEESYKMIRDIEMCLRNDFKEKLSYKYGPSWFTLGLPKNVYDAATKLAADKNYESGATGETYEVWDCLTLINYREISIYGNNWSELFEKSYTKPGEEKLSGGKKAKTEWFVKLSRIRNENFHTYSVTKDEYNFLKELHHWLIEKR